MESKSGTWKPIEEIFKYSKQWSCSVCEQPTCTDRHNYCPHCGAQMKSEYDYEPNPISLTAEIEAMKAENERLNETLISAISDLDSTADCSTCKFYDKEPCSHGIGCYKWRGLEE